MRRKQDLFSGAAVLAGAGLVVKVIGACFKIPLGAMLQPEGNAIFSVAYNLYALLFALATAGVPVAVSRMVALSASEGRYCDAQDTVRVALSAFSLIGALGAGILWFGAEFFASAMGVFEASAAIRAVAPAVFFVSLLSVLRGYYQGFCDMVPTAVSEVIEAAVKLFFGLFLAWWFKQQGGSLASQAAGAIVGVTVGAAVACGYLAVIRRRVTVAFPKGEKSRKKFHTRLKELFSETLPITLSASVIGLTNVIDSGLIMNLLRESGCSMREAMCLFGTYTYATNLFGLPNVLISTIAVSLVPAVAGKNCVAVGTAARDTISVAATLSVASACGLGVLAYPILKLLYGSGVEDAALKTAGGLLSLLCFAIPPLALATVVNALHQAEGKARVTVVAMMAGAAVKLIANLCLVRISKIRIYGAAISTILCYLTICGVDFFHLKRDEPLLKLFVRPILIGVSTGCAAKVSHSCLKTVFSTEIATFLSVFCGGMIFLILAFITKDTVFVHFNAKKTVKKVKK